MASSSGSGSSNNTFEARVTNLIAAAVGKAVGSVMSDGYRKQAIGSNQPASDTFRGIGALLFRYVAAPLMSLAVLSQVITSTTSGFEVFTRSVGLLAATLGTVLTPVFTLLSAAVLATSGYLMDSLLPALGNFYEWVGTFTSRFSSGLDEFQHRFSSGWDRVTGGTGERPDGGIAGSPRVHDGQSLGDYFRNGLRDAIEQQRLASMPRATSSGLVQASLNAQMNALNSDPIQRRMLDLQQRSNELLQRIADGHSGFAR